MRIKGWQSLQIPERDFALTNKILCLFLVFASRNLETTD